MRTQLGRWGLGALLLACVSGISSYAKTLKELEKTASEAKSLQELLSTPLLREHYSQALKSYLQRDRFRCQSFEKIVTEVEKQINEVPELASQLWEKRTQEEYSFLAMQKMVTSAKAPARRVPYRLVSAPRPFHALFADPTTTGCLSDQCDHNSRMGAERWTVALKKSRVYFVEREGIYNDLTLHIVPVKKDQKTYGLVYTTGGPAWNRNWEMWNPKTKKPYETTLLKFALAQIRAANPDVWDGFLEKETPSTQVAKKKKIFSDKTKSEIVQNEAFRFVPEDGLVIRMQAHFPRICAAENAKLSLMQFATADDNAKFIAIVPETGFVLPFSAGTTQASTTSTTTTNPLSTLAAANSNPNGSSQKITLEIGNQKQTESSTRDFDRRDATAPQELTPFTPKGSGSTASTPIPDRGVASTSPVNSEGSINIIHEGINVEPSGGNTPVVISQNYSTAEYPEDSNNRGGAAERPKRSALEYLQRRIARSANPAKLAQEELARTIWSAEQRQRAEQDFRQEFEKECNGAKKTKSSWFDWGNRLLGIPEAVATENHGPSSKALREIDDCDSTIPSSLKPKKVYRGHFVWNESKKIYERDLSGKAECVAILTDAGGVPVYELQPYSMVGPEMLDLVTDPKIKAYMYFDDNKFEPYCNSDVDNLKVRLKAGQEEITISLKDFRDKKAPKNSVASSSEKEEEPEPKLNDTPRSCGELVLDNLKDLIGYEQEPTGQWSRYRKACPMCDGPPTCISFYNPPEDLPDPERTVACLSKELRKACSVCEKADTEQCASLKERLKRGIL